MQISNTLLSSHLQDVYWITGGACAGKTTVTNLLSEKHGIAVFPDRFSEYRAAADLEEFPAMRYPSPQTDWEWFFNREINEYVGWLEMLAAHLVEFIVVDLISGDLPRPIIVEQFTDPLSTARIAGHNREVSMFATDELLEVELLQRDDHKMILDCIQANTSDPVVSEKNVIAASVEAAHRSHNRALTAGCKILYRDEHTQPQELLAQVEEHFGLIG